MFFGSSWEEPSQNQAADTGPLQLLKRLHKIDQSDASKAHVGQDARHDLELLELLHRHGPTF